MERAMRRIMRVVMFVVMGVAAVFLFGFILMLLWNWLIPAVFGWHAITYWQALGLLILCKILFGGFRGHGGGNRHWRRRMMERWEKMTPEEREKFRERMHGRCGHFDAPASEAKT